MILIALVACICKNKEVLLLLGYVSEHSSISHLNQLSSTVFSSLSLGLLPERSATLMVYDDVVQIVSGFQGKLIFGSWNWNLNDISIKQTKKNLPASYILNSIVWVRLVFRMGFLWVPYRMLLSGMVLLNRLIVKFIPNCCD